MEHATTEHMGDARRPATYEDLMAVPEHLVAEIIDGELITSPRPASPHALACSGILSVLFDRFNGSAGGPSAPGGWWILFEPELHLGADVLVPDLAGWRRERMPVMHSAPWFDLPPDWVCEVVSPSSGRLDRVRKMPKYAKAGVGHLWLVEPLGRMVETVLPGDATSRIPPFDSVEIDPRRWWLDPDA
jgi:Uma2 family endonuclease